MNKSHGLVVLALALSVATGCSRSADSAPSASAPAVAAANAPTGGLAMGGEEQGTASAGASPLAASRALVVTSEIHVKAKDVRAAVATIRSEAEKAGGYVADANEAGSGNTKSATIEIRVPAAKAKTVRVLLSDLGEITSDVEKVEDVTEARADLGARLANARAEEKRIHEIMAQRAGSIGEVLQAEKELSRVRETIERLEAQHRTMEGRIALATVKIHLSMPGSATEEPEAWRTPGRSIERAFSAGLRGAAAILVYGAMALAAASPILVPFGLVLGTSFALLRRKKKATLAATAAS